MKKIIKNGEFIVMGEGEMLQYLKALATELDSKANDKFIIGGTKNKKIKEAEVEIIEFESTINITNAGVKIVIEEFKSRLKASKKKRVVIGKAFYPEIENNDVTKLLEELVLTPIVKKAVKTPLNTTVVKYAQAKVV